MADFIRDVRNDLDAPRMPFVIGVMGVGGIKDQPDYFRQAMAAPAELPEFKGNVAAVETAPFWDEPLAAIAEKLGKPRGLAYHLGKGGLPGKVAADRYPLAYALRKDYWDTDPKDRKMTKQQQQAYVEEYRDKLITPEDEALWKTRRLQRRLPLSRLCQDVCPDRQGLRRGHGGDGEEASIQLHKESQAMTHCNRMKAILALTAFAIVGCAGDAAAENLAKPLKVYILAGQSNMQGLGTIAPATTPGTLEYTVANDPDKAYQFLVDADGKWVVRDDVRIRYISKHGGLTPGYGGGHDAEPKYIGPELGFGHHVGDRLENPVLIIKASWGGKSLGADFRPPSSGGETGHYYKEVLRLVKETVSDLQTYVPDYQGQGYEIAGFAWHQGWNDRINPKFTAEYAENMANFIRDMRKDLGVPNLPFVIATTGMDGEKRYTDLERAQLSLADPKVFPEFAGNVSVIDTRAGGYEGMDFWQDADMSPSAGGTHWNKNAKTYLNMGIAMADADAAHSARTLPVPPTSQGRRRGR